MSKFHPNSFQKNRSICRPWPSHYGLWTRIGCSMSAYGTIFISGANLDEIWTWLLNAMMLTSALLKLNFHRKSYNIQIAWCFISLKTFCWKLSYDGTCLEELLLNSKKKLLYNYYYCYFHRNIRYSKYWNSHRTSPMKECILSKVFSQKAENFAQTTLLQR